MRAAYQPFYQGLFLAPHAVAQAVQHRRAGCPAVCEAAGHALHPRASDAPAQRTSSRRMELGTPERLIAFCQGIQAASPIDSHGRAGALGHARLRSIRSSWRRAPSSAGASIELSARTRPMRRALHRVFAGRPHVQPRQARPGQRPGKNARGALYFPDRLRI